MGDFIVHYCVNSNGRIIFGQKGIIIGKLDSEFII